MKKKILVFMGTRPEVVKLAPLVAALRAHAAGFEVRVCLTSQHREMLQQALRWFSVDVDEDLGVMREQQQLSDVLAAILPKASELIAQYRPDAVVVQGDTGSAFACALAGFHDNIPVAHVEAGLRSGARDAPWPEEMYRRLISRIALHHFAPTQKNADLLRAEQVDGQIHVVGNTVIDAVLDMRSRIRADDALLNKIKTELNTHTDRPFMLVTSHRRESHDSGGLDNICRALAALAQQFTQYDLVYAVHLNPRVRETAHRLLSGRDNIVLSPPLDYAHFVYLMSECRLILTDSGGVQEEAPSLDKPVLVMRDVTERPEVVESGAAKLVGTQTRSIVAAARELLENESSYAAMAKSENPYGDGRAAQRIADLLASTP